MDDPSVTAEPEVPRLARIVGSDEAMVWTRRVLLGLALAFLVGAVGYRIGVWRTEPPRSAVDVGFLADMTNHHDQAIEMATLNLAYGADTTTRGFALEVIMFQRFELGRFRNFQDGQGIPQPDYDPERITMAWMDMPTPLRDMPGMATAEALAELRKLRGTAHDLRFLELMQQHHLGGAHMSEYASLHARDPAIRELASVMARNQRTEVAEYQVEIDRLKAQG